LKQPALILALLGLLLGSLTAPVLAGPPGDARGDPPRDTAHPARNRQLVIPSGPVRPGLGRPAELNALFFLAAGEGPHPTMILLHGLPGNERNLDLAQAVRRAGWIVLTFPYRGAWGSEGTFSILHAIADSQAALSLIRSRAAVALYRIDPRRIVVAGHSMGGYIAAHTAAHDAPGAPPLAGIVLLDAWDIGEDAAALRSGGAQARAAFLAGFDDLGHALGPITAADLYDNLLRRGREWRLAPLAPRLTGQPVLTLFATHGGAGQNRAFAATLRSAGVRVTAQELDSDHAFADHRIALAEAVVAWLARLGPPAG
jgi:acetyl esterase/lipase